MCNYSISKKHENPDVIFVYDCCLSERINRFEMVVERRRKRVYGIPFSLLILWLLRLSVSDAFEEAVFVHLLSGVAVACADPANSVRKGGCEPYSYARTCSFTLELVLSLASSTFILHFDGRSLPSVEKHIEQRPVQAVVE